MGASGAVYPPTGLYPQARILPGNQYFRLLRARISRYFRRAGTVSQSKPLPGFPKKIRKPINRWLRMVIHLGAQAIIPVDGPVYPAEGLPDFRGAIPAGSAL